MLDSLFSQTAVYGALPASEIRFFTRIIISRKVPESVRWSTHKFATPTNSRLTLATGTQADRMRFKRLTVDTFSGLTLSICETTAERLSWGGLLPTSGPEGARTRCSSPSAGR
jgi:hypothetical protein